MAAFYIASNHSEHLGLLSAYYMQTDQAIKQVIHWPQGPDIIYTSSLDLAQFLQNQRLDIDNQGTVTLIGTIQKTLQGRVEAFRRSPDIVIHWRGHLDFANLPRGPTKISK